MTPSADDYREAVSNGAALLDARVPGWRDRVDVATLHLSSCEHCTLGQLFGDYLVGKRYLELDGGTSCAIYGFRLPPDLPTVEAEEDDAHWSALTDAWVKELQR